MGRCLDAVRLLGQRGKQLPLMRQLGFEFRQLPELLDSEVAVLSLHFNQLVIKRGVGKKLLSWRAGSPGRERESLCVEILGKRHGLMSPP